MQAYDVIYLLKEKAYDTLLSLAQGELMNKVLKQYGHITTAQRLQAAEKYLDAPGKNHYAWKRDGFLYLTDGHSAYMLLDGDLQVDITGGPTQEVARHFNDEPGKIARVVWMTLHLEIEMHKGTDHRREPLYARVGEVHLNADYLAQAYSILGGGNLCIYTYGKKLPVQIEGESGKAILLPVIIGETATPCIVDVTAPEQAA